MSEIKYIKKVLHIVHLKNSHHLLCSDILYLKYMFDTSEYLPNKKIRPYFYLIVKSDINKTNKLQFPYCIIIRYIQHNLVV